MALSVLGGEVEPRLTYSPKKENGFFIVVDEKIVAEVAMNTIRRRRELIQRLSFILDD